MALCQSNRLTHTGSLAARRFAPVTLRLRHEVRRELGDDVRIAVHGNYNIYFRFIGPNLENVQIIRVINAAMNVDDGDLE